MPLRLADAPDHQAGRWPSLRLPARVLETESKLGPRLVRLACRPTEWTFRVRRVRAACQVDIEVTAVGGDVHEFL